jgi:hypothetical protein
MGQMIIKLPDMPPSRTARAVAVLMLVIIPLSAVPDASPASQCDKLLLSARRSADAEADRLLTRLRSTYPRPVVRLSMDVRFSGRQRICTYVCQQPSAPTP